MLDKNFDINNFLHSSDIGIHIIGAIGCAGTPIDDAHGLAIAFIRGNGYYSVIFVGFLTGLYFAHENGGTSYVNWIKVA